MTDETTPMTYEATAADKPAENADITGASTLPADELHRLTDDIVAAIKTVYDRSGLIHRSIDTLKHKLTEEMLVVSLVIASCGRTTHLHGTVRLAMPGGAVEFDPYEPVRRTGWLHFSGSGRGVLVVQPAVVLMSLEARGL